MEHSKNEKILFELRMIREKIDKAPAMNGGFAQLSKKVEMIRVDQELMKKDLEVVKQTHQKIIDNLTELSDSLHKPKTGLFSQIEHVELTQTNRNQSISNSVNLVDSRVKEIEEKIDDEIEPKFSIIKQNEDDVCELKEWKKSASKSFFAVMAFLGMTLVGFIVFLIQEITKGNLF